VAVDSAGDVFIADTFNNQVVEVPAGVAVMVHVPTAISLSASSATPVYGQGVTLTATVTVPAGDPSPTAADGTVTFYDNGKALGPPVALSGSTATLTNVMLSAGPHSITASYSGDSTFAAIPMGQCVVPATGLYFPESVAVDSAGNVYIADTGNNQVVVVPKNGTPFDVGYFEQLNGGQYTTTAFSGPFAVAAVGPGLADVTDGTGALVQISLGGVPIQIGFGIVTPPGQATDSQGDTFYADPAHNQVVEVKADGSVTTVGSGLNHPNGVAVDAAGDVFIADSGNNRVVEVLAGLPVNVGRATPTLSVSDAGGTYNGNAFAATDSVAGVVPGVDSTPAGTLEGVAPSLMYYQGTYTTVAALNSALASGLTGSSTAPSLAGSYTVLASFAGSADYSNGQALATFAIGQASPTVSVSDAGGTYNGNAFAASDSVAGLNNLPASTLEGVAPTLTYYQGAYTTLAALNTALAGGLTGSSTAPRVAGSYTVLASFAGSTDYSCGQAISNFTIGQAMPTVSVSDAGGTYNGNAFAATDAVAGVDNVPAGTLEGVAPTLTYYQGTYNTLAALNTAIAGGLTGSGAAPSLAGSYTVVASFAGSTDYSSSQTLATFTIGQATPTVSVSDAGGTYNQNPFAATATVAGVNGMAGTSLEGVSPTLKYYQGSTASGTPLAGPPTLPGTYTVQASFAGSADYTAASATTTFIIQTPTTSITGPSIGVPGQPLTYTFAVNGPTQGIAFTINFGDGTSVTTSAGGPTIKLDHLYPTTGAFTIQVTAKDQNGVVSQSANQSVKISTVALESDPSGGTALAVGGNAAGGDTILVSAADTTGKTVDVTINKTDYGTFTPTGHLLVYGQGGKDSITLKAHHGTGYIEVPAMLYGEGSGGDKISAAGSAANNVLTGHGNNEVLTGGQGRDLLIGGTGSATLYAGAGDDLLLGGSTSYDIGSSSGLTYDQQLAALDAIMAEWGSADSYSTRLSALAGSLNTSTVHASYQNGQPVVDSLYGNANANDWFFAAVNAVIKGKNQNDVVTTIS
jgi:sugar lactone lactonase YvrE